MAVNAWEEGLNQEVWVNGHKCGTCSGTLKYKYYRKGIIGLELWIFPNRGTFQVMRNGKMGLNGSLSVMKTLLDAATFE